MTPFSIGSGGSGISLSLVGGLVDQIGQHRNLLGRREHQIDRFIDIVLDRIERHHTGLSDPRSNAASDVKTAAAVGRHIERRACRQNFA